MATTQPRTLQDIDVNAPAVAAKKAKTVNNEVLTFMVDHSPVQVQLLSEHSVHDLVDIICQTTTIGQNGTVYAHMWYVQVNGKKYESGDRGYVSKLRATEYTLGDLKLAPNTAMALAYDYGAGGGYSITLVEKSEQEEGSTTTYPCRKAIATPAYTVFKTASADLNALFPQLNHWTFTDGQSSTYDLNLFQAGKKQHFAFLQRNFNGCCDMIYLPMKAGNDLVDYFHSLEYATQFKVASEDGSCPCYNWHSVVVLPTEAPQNKTEKYGEGKRRGFCDCVRPPSAYAGSSLNCVFPKVAALAGYKKDKKVRKGWVCYKNKTLRICSGNAQKHTMNAPKKTAYDGKDQFKPESDAILFTADIEITSMHHLLCVIEGFLSTL